MNVNGFSTVSHPGTSGTFSPGSTPAGAQPLRAYDCLWDYAAYAPTGSLKDGAQPTLGQFPLNGVAGGSRPASPGHGTNLRAAGQEFWGNGTAAGPMGLNFDSQELYDSFHEQSFELMQNGPDGFYTAAGQASPVLSSDTQPFPNPGQGDADGAAKEMPTTTTSTILENGGGLVGSQELEEAQPGRSPGGLAELWDAALGSWQVGDGCWWSWASSSLGNPSCSDPPVQCPGWGLVGHSLEQALGFHKTRLGTAQGVTARCHGGLGVPSRGTAVGIPRLCHRHISGSVFGQFFSSDLKMCSYNGAAASATGSLGPEGPVLAPRDSGCLGDASPIAPRLEDPHILSEDPLEPFESLARGR